MFLELFLLDSMNFSPQVLLIILIIIILVVGFYFYKKSQKENMENMDDEEMEEEMDDMDEEMGEMDENVEDELMDMNGSIEMPEDEMVEEESPEQNLSNMEMGNEEPMIENFTDSEFKQGSGWWNNVINCEANGSNDIYCKKQEDWVFPY